MTNDIVVRLRRVAERIPKKSGDEPNPYYQRCHDAADEIEQLRTQLDSLLSLYDAQSQQLNLDYTLSEHHYNFIVEYAKKNNKSFDQAIADAIQSYIIQYTYDDIVKNGL